MSITYLRNRARELRHTHTEAEYQALLEKLAHHLNVASDGESLTSAQKQEVLARLRQLGINTNRTTQHG